MVSMCFAVQQLAVCITEKSAEKNEAPPAQPHPQRTAEASSPMVSTEAATRAVSVPEAEEVAWFRK